MVKLIYNQELNGIEVYFDSKPEQSIINSLKDHGFRWSNFKKCWYARQNERTIKEAEKYISEDITAEQTETKTERTTMVKKNVTQSLYERITFTPGTANYDKDRYKFVGSNYTGLSVKETAATIRKHLKERFPEVKFSVTSDYNSIDVTIKASPYDYKTLAYSPDISPYEYRKFEEENNKEINAIVDYCKKLLTSYNWDDSDSMTDYFNCHFYEHVYIDRDYVQTEQTEAIKADITDFRNRLEQDIKIEQERQEKEYQEQAKKREEEHKAYLARLEEEKKQAEIINNSVIVKDLSEFEQYFVIGSQFARLNKNNTLDEYIEEVKAGEYYLQDLKVTREVHFTNEQALNYYNNLLLTDFDFITDTGGSQTDDNRIQSMIDYDNMDQEEQKTVEWYSLGIAVYFNDKLQYVIDAQGYNYARYVGLIGENTKIVKERITKQAITAEQQAEYKIISDVITDYSTNTITELGIAETWNNTDWTTYKELITEQLKKNNIKLCKEYIQQIDGDLTELKQAMYRLLKEVDNIQDQFKNANLQQGQKITLFYINDFGGMSHTKITVDKVEYAKYAQHDKAVKLIYKPQNKRSLYCQYFYRDMLVYNGWLDLPETVLNTVENTGTGITITHSKYLSCDKRQYDEIINYFITAGHKPIINTYKPIF